MKERVTAIQDIMIKRCWSLAVAESLTSGNIQALLASISDSSKYFEGGITAYSLRQKTQHLKINESHAKKVNCVSHRVAQEMAIGITKLYGTKFGIATTGYASKYPEQNITEPYAYVAIYDKTRNVVFSTKVNGAELERTEMQMYVSEAALLMFHNYLTSSHRWFSRKLQELKINRCRRSRRRNRLVIAIRVKILFIEYKKGLSVL